MRRFKNCLWGVLTLVSMSMAAQVSVSSKFVGSSAKKLNKELLAAVKSSDLVFICPDYLESDDVFKILSEIWTYGNVYIASRTDFSISEYMQKNVVLADLDASLVLYDNAYMVRQQIDLDSYNVDQLRERVQEIKSKNYSEKKLKKRLDKEFHNARRLIARVWLHDDPSYSSNVKSASRDSKQEAFRTMYEKPTFDNFNLGMLKNHFQLIVSELDGKAKRSYYKDYASDQLTELKDKTLYVPSYIFEKYNPWTTEESADPKFEQKLMSKYKFAYEKIAVEDLSTKILSGEDFYYVRFARVVSERFLEVVHAPTGNVIYNKHSAGLLKYNLTSKHFKAISKKID